MSRKRQGDRPKQRLFATAARGTEPALRDELKTLRFHDVRAARGGVHFGGGLEDGYRACLELATASRVLYELAAFEAPTGDALYEGVRAIDWSFVLTPRHTLAVRAACRDGALTHTQFIAQRTKDAIVDPMRERTGERPSVDVADPDVSIFVHVVRDQATVYLDLAGEPLHRRGYRADPGNAPLKETLAAALVHLSGWDGARPLVDPMCGSGTIAIEAARAARGIAPGILRRRFGFERWASFDAQGAAAIRALREQAKARVTAGPPVHASDVDPTAIAAVIENARRAGVEIEVRRVDVRELGPASPPGHVVTNPPYGERIAASQDLYDGMARALLRLRDHRASILAAGPDVVRGFTMRPSSSYEVWNGDIACRLLTYEILR